MHIFFRLKGRESLLPPISTFLAWYISCTQCQLGNYDKSQTCGGERHGSFKFLPLGNCQFLSRGTIDSPKITEEGKRTMILLSSNLGTGCVTCHDAYCHKEKFNCYRQWIERETIFGTGAQVFYKGCWQVLDEVSVMLQQACFYFTLNLIPML